MKNIFILVIILLLSCSRQKQSGFDQFITRQGDKLMAGDREFRFLSFNIPNLHFIEDSMPFEEQNPYRLPDSFEITDALLSVKQMGGQVVRTYTITVFKEEAPENFPCHVLGPGQFNEEAFVALDRMLALANQIGIRLIIPLVDNWQWLGGVPQYAQFRNKQMQEFWTDSLLIADFKKTIAFVLNRKNTITGITYKDDKAIMAWETGNELYSPPVWTAEIAAYLKSLDANHLVLDGTGAAVLRDEVISQPDIDLLQTHHYEKDPREMIAHIRQNWQKARGKKPYHLGEFGFVGTEAILAVLQTLIDEGISGGLIWSLRFHNRDGGFYWHYEPYGGDLFKAYHWPGFSSGDAYDERNLLQLYREKAYAIRNMPVPPIAAPPAPRLLPIEDPAAISWQGSAGASFYQIDRVQNPADQWQVLADGISDAEMQYRPLYNDRSAVPGNSYYYRVLAKNSGGISIPSNIMGPVTPDHYTLIDEFRNDSHIFYRKGDFTFQQNEARKYKEDAHRLQGSTGSELVYYLPQPLHACTLYTFAASDSSQLQLYLSDNGRDFNAVTSDYQSFSTGKGEYGYLYPVRYRYQTDTDDNTYLKIVFTAPCTLSRLEITYGMVQKQPR
jgi:mannan endo-1,4-beta-mannosidase